MRLAILVLLGLVSPLGAAELTLAVELRWSGNGLQVPSGEVVTAGGQTVRVTRLAALVSEVVLVCAEGGAVRLDGQFGFIDAESGRMSLALRGVPEGDYAGLEFGVGLPREVNHGDPAKWPARHGLNPLVNWRATRLEFTATPLGEAVALMNRFNEVQFEISDRDIARLEVSGFFRADNAATFLRLIEQSLGVRGERRGQTIVLHKAR